MTFGNGSDTNATPRRILHVFAKMDRGGAETWAVNVLRHIDRRKYQFDFLVSSNEPGSYDEVIREFGGRVIQAPRPSSPVKFSNALRKVLREQGPYDAIHSHLHHFSGLVMLVGRLAGVPVRIAHSHSDISSIQENASSLRRMYYFAAGAIIRQFSTSGIGVSSLAASSLFGANWRADDRIVLMPCGIDLQPFESEYNRTATRSRYGIDPGTFVVGHVGRFALMKNHTFLLQVFARLLQKRPDSTLVLMGDGPLRAEIEKEIERLGLGNNTMLLGSVPNVTELLQGLLDVFVFPSLYEGLGVSVVEAQAAGLPCVVSDVIPDEADVVPGAVSRLNLGAEIDQWVDAVLDQGADRERPSNALQTVASSQFNILGNITFLEKLYQGDDHAT